MERSFVILAHGGQGALHYDLMLEEGASLATWQLSAAPSNWQEGQPVAAKKLPDHRRDYLTYEGPVSKGRGIVKRADAGTFETLRAADGMWEVRLAGGIVRGSFELRRVGPEADAWELRRVAAEG